MRASVLAIQALEREQHVNEALQEPAYFQPNTSAIRNVQPQASSAEAAAQAVSPAAASPEQLQHRNVGQRTVKYSRKAVPSAKEQQQAANAQYVQAMKEYFAEVWPSSVRTQPLHLCHKCF